MTIDITPEAAEVLSVWYDGAGNPMTVNPMRDLSAALSASRAKRDAAVATLSTLSDGEER